MRWAGSLLCFSVGLMACGGRAPADAVDAGSNPVVTPDGGTDGGEIEAVGRADIAVHHGAEMEPDAEGERRQAGADALGVEACHPVP